MLFELDDETVAIIRGLCDVGLKTGGLQAFVQVSKVLAMIQTPLPTESANKEKAIPPIDLSKEAKS